MQFVTVSMHNWQNVLRDLSRIRVGIRVRVRARFRSEICKLCMHDFYYLSKLCSAYCKLGRLTNVRNMPMICDASLTCPAGEVCDHRHRTSWTFQARTSCLSVTGHSAQLALGCGTPCRVKLWKARLWKFLDEN